jgi:hypothetical protein
MDRHAEDDDPSPGVSIGEAVRRVAVRGRRRALHAIGDKPKPAEALVTSLAMLGAGLSASDDLYCLPPGMLANMQQIVALGVAIGTEGERFWDIKWWVADGRRGDAPAAVRMAAVLVDLAAAWVSLHARMVAWLAAAASDAGRIELVRGTMPVLPVAGRARERALHAVGAESGPVRALVTGLAMLTAGLRACDDLSCLPPDMFTDIQRLAALGVTLSAADAGPGRAADAPRAVRMAALLDVLNVAIGTLHSSMVAWLAAAASDAKRIDYAAAELIAGRAIVTATLWRVFAVHGGSDGA